MSAALAQHRLATTLQRLGPPQQVNADPHAGTVELHGRVFAAQAIGSLDGARWTWSWADERHGYKMQLGRGLRDAAETLGVPVFAVPSIAEVDEPLVHAIGAIAVAHGHGDAYWIAAPSVLYLIERGQLDLPTGSRVEALTRALSAASELSIDVAIAVRFAARRLGLVVVERPLGFSVRDDVSGDVRTFSLLSEGP
ncbi:MAG: DUF6882 domain-containing protein [Polyangia bacterium]